MPKRLITAGESLRSSDQISADCFEILLWAQAKAAGFDLLFPLPLPSAPVLALPCPAPPALCTADAHVQQHDFYPLSRTHPPSPCCGFWPPQYRISFTSKPNDRRWFLPLDREILPPLLTTRVLNGGELQRILHTQHVWSSSDPPRVARELACLSKWGGVCFFGR